MAAFEDINAILTPNIEFSTLTTDSRLAYLSIVDRSSWETKKNDTSFFACLTKLIPLNLGASFEEFQTARTAYFKEIGFNSSETQSISSLRSHISDAQVTAWAQAMSTRGRAGLVLFSKGINNHSVTLEVIWITPPGSKAASVKVDFTIMGGTLLLPRRGKITDGTAQDVILNNGSNVFILQRHETRDLTVTVSGAGYSASYSLDSVETTRMKAMIPIGTVVHSMLAPEDYARVTGQDCGWDPVCVTWVPADGRSVAGSLYSRLLHCSTVPDVRGYFFRSLNYSERGLSVSVDPDAGRSPGSRQDCEVQAHAHGISCMRLEAQGGKGFEGSGLRSNSEQKSPYTDPASTHPSGGLETRPKNIAMFAYIKIN